MPQASRSHPHSLLVNTAQPEGRNTKKPERETEPARRAKHNPARRGKIQPSPKGERICSPGREPGDRGPRFIDAARPRPSRRSADPPITKLPTYEITKLHRTNSASQSYHSHTGGRETNSYCNYNQPRCFI